MTPGHLSAAEAVTGSSSWVQHGYTAMSDGANHSRPTTLTYPDGRVVGYAYGTTGSVNDKVSRLDGLNSR